jgi:hypothetical protein
MRQPAWIFQDLIVRQSTVYEYCTIFLRRMPLRIQVTANREDKRKMFFILNS